ncbi:hypothetical protein BS50DRAFT_665398 [Corynespora cassiicola Philippines]|uniref:Uncharacterized protein n=1 Tax=Corynespora cassiicola Philippines TaxID=1448308 RepID=A0A2T2NRD2_CORCC|nr:hypothetical protein BS50DRAFT_665398 [Corynespora cassiicola Philippines]
MGSSIMHILALLLFLFNLALATPSPPSSVEVNNSSSLILPRDRSTCKFHIRLTAQCPENRYDQNMEVYMKVTGLSDSFNIHREVQGVGQDIIVSGNQKGSLTNFYNNHKMEFTWHSDKNADQDQLDIHYAGSSVTDGWSVDWNTCKKGKWTKDVKKSLDYPRPDAVMDCRDKDPKMRGSNRQRTRDMDCTVIC